MAARRADALILAAVVTLAGGITVIAVRNSHESRRRMMCASNLRQIGIALHTYSEFHGGAFPFGTEVNTGLPPEKRLSWYTQAWPFFEGSQLRTEDSKPWNSPENLRLRAVGMYGRPFEVKEVELFFCPSCENTGELGLPNVTTYVGIAGIGADAPLLPLDDPKAGIWGYDRQTPLEKITDGLSSTIMVAETSSELGPWTAGGQVTVRGLVPKRQPYIGPRRQFGGFHRGGAMVLFADASVQFVHEEIDSRVLEALSTIAGGEEVKRSSGTIEKLKGEGVTQSRPP